jgi:hypothetical protein
VNLKIKSARSFRDAHSDRMYMYMFIVVNARMYISTWLEKKNSRLEAYGLSIARIKMVYFYGSLAAMCLSRKGCFLLLSFA